MTERIFKHRKTEEVCILIGTARQTFAKKPDRVFAIYRHPESNDWLVKRSDQFFNGDLQEVS
jgi:hypothetical protein